MQDTAHRAIAIVGVGAILPDAPNVSTFWNNVKGGRYSISDVPLDRWDPALYYDADHGASDKTYSKIGGWVREFPWDPMKWHLAVPPRVVDAMDDAQKWAIACTREALQDYGFPERALDGDRTAVILGNAMAGEKHYFTALRLYFPEYARELAETASFVALPEGVRRSLTAELHRRVGRLVPAVTEDTMPGELANCIAGRIANIYNFHGPNYVVDAACASAMAAMSAAAGGLIENKFDVAITGGIDRNMGASSYIKFSKIGALSATGTRPYAKGADGFVMGEGAVIFVLKRLADAERDADRIYAVLRGIAGSSDGKGKGITAPNPIGQKFAIERAWQDAGLSPASATLMEGHGTSTSVGDVVEVQSMTDILNGFQLPAKSVALGSVKSNIGHLKGAAGAAGLLKVVLALRNKVLPPSIHCEQPNPDIDFAHSPLYVNTELKEWLVSPDSTRRAGLSAFGFGGTNFHAVLEEYVPGELSGNGKHTFAVENRTDRLASVEGISARQPSTVSQAEVSRKPPLRGALVIGAESATALADRLRAVQENAQKGCSPAAAPPAAADLRACERLAIDYANAADLVDKSTKALKALAANQLAIWKALRAQGIFRGSGKAGKIAFLYTGQGSQYVNMLRPLRDAEPIVAQTFAEADRIMTPLLGKPLSEFVFVDSTDEEAVANADNDLRQTAITQPAVLAIDTAMTRLLAAYGIRPDMTMGHSLGEYGALVASEALSFQDALAAVSARGRGMTEVAMEDNGRMAAIFAPLNEVERILKTVPGYVVIANVNSDSQSVIGGASDAVAQAMEIFLKAGFNALELPVSHAFHTSIVAPASRPLWEMMSHLHLASPRVPIVANLNGEFYPTGPDVVPQMLDILAQQVASPVQFVKGLHTLYDAGARIFVEVGPKKALQGFAEDVLGNKGDVVALFTNHPKVGDVASFNQALCGLYAAGAGLETVGTQCENPSRAAVSSRPIAVNPPSTIPTTSTSEIGPTMSTAIPTDRYFELGRLMAESLTRAGLNPQPGSSSPVTAPVVVTGAAIGLPGVEHIFDDGNIERILRGDQFIRAIPARFRNAMVDKRVTRLMKSDKGGPTFESIESVADVIKVAGRGGAFDFENEFGVSAERVAALDRVTRLAIAAGIDALRDAGIPLVMRYKTTTRGTQLPDRWGLPDLLRDDTGVIFGSAFPGYDSFAEIMSEYYADHARREELARLENWRAQAAAGQSILGQDIDRRIEELRAAIEKKPFVFDRRFLFRTLSMGHSQFAEYIGARGPNTQINSACATTAQAVSLAEDWIHAGRCRRVIVISADDVTSDNMIEWFGAGFLASGAAATDEIVAEAATPFDRRRHGLIMGMGAAALVVESAEAAKERGIRPLCEVLGTITSNSAFHGSRLDVQHISQIMEQLIAKIEALHGISRSQLAPRTVFVSHETYTPARGGSASAEIFALRKVFGDTADQIVIANTKGFTGHAMATGIEEVVAVKSLETGCVPPVANFKEVDPDLGILNLSKGGQYPVEYALRLGAGFGSQISMTVFHRIGVEGQERPKPNALGYTHRIADQNVWSNWINCVAGRPSAELEVVRRTLRVKDQGLAARVAETIQASHSTPASESTSPQTPAHQSNPVGTAFSSPTMNPAAEPNPISTVPAQNNSVKNRVLSLVSDKTGYPVDMLDLDLDMEADLGVDTVKQAEVFAAIREAYGIARDDSIKLRDYPTLNHVIRFVHDRRSSSGTPTPVTDASTPQINTNVPEAPAQAQSHDAVKQRILALVVEKTGYPSDMLDLDLDLEADLGVDTVKQAEMFAAIREIYNIPRDENLKLREYPTLAHVIRFVQQKRPDLVTVNPPTTSSPSSAGASAPAVTAVVVPATDSAPISQNDAGNDVKKRILALVVEKTGYPSDMLDLDLDLEADLGVDTVKQAEMFAAIREIYDIPRDENRKLRDYPTLAHVISFVYENRPDLATTKIESVKANPTAPEATVPIIRPPSSDDDVKQTVLAIVAKQTGYPQDMLDLDLDLEADLGIDTVKQAEMFAAVRAAYNIPRDEAVKLRDFPTLGHVIQFAQNRRPGAANLPVDAAPGAAANASYIPHSTKTTAGPIRPPLLSFDAADRIPRRVPVPTLRPPLNLCKPTGVNLGSGSRIVLMPDKGGVADALTPRLEALGVEVLRVDQTPDADTLLNLLQNWLSAGPVQGVYWLPALDNEGTLGDMNLGQWREALRIRVKSYYIAMRALSEQIAPAGSFLVAATLLGGQHGYDEAGAVAPMGGAVSGFTKAYKRERSEALVKAIDFETQRDPAAVAALLFDETLRDPGAVEIGYKAGLRWTISLQEQSVADGKPALTLNQNSIFLVTGAAGSIVSAITADLAAASGGTFYLLDLVPEPNPNDDDLRRFTQDKDGLKRDLFARIQSRGERATPSLVEKELAALERAQAAQSAIDAVRAAGGTAHYFSVNLTDGAAVTTIIDHVRQNRGRIDVLLHAAGTERSHFLVDKESREFDLVFDVKSDGWFNLLRAIGDMPLGATVAFSSVAGRFGNGGQTDYSAANDLLCKVTSSFRTTRPATRGIVIDWSAWAGIGMATRGSIPKMMELAGIDMLSPEAGIPWIRRELTMGGTRSEIVVGQRLGVLLQEWDPTGGLDVNTLQSSATLAKRGPMIGTITGMGIYSGLTMETTLDPKVQAFLYDHRMDGTPVLPGVMGLEAFAEAALCVYPGWHVDAIEEVDFLAPFKFYRNDPRTATIQAFFHPQGNNLVADCRLIGRRSLPGQAEPQVTIHFTARVRLAQSIPTALTTAPIDVTSDFIVDAAQIYRIYFHGPAYQVLERAWRDGDRIIGALAEHLPGDHVPASQLTVAAPRLIELCFQTAGLLEMTSQSRMGLPQHIREVCWSRDPESAEGRLYAVVTPQPDQSTFDAEVVDKKGNCYLRLAGYRTVALPNNLDPESLKALEPLTSPQAVLA